MKKNEYMRLLKEKLNQFDETLQRNTINRNFIMSIQFRPFTLC